MPLYVHWLYSLLLEKYGFLHTQFFSFYRIPNFLHQSKRALRVQEPNLRREGDLQHLTCYPAEAVN